MRRTQLYLDEDLWSALHIRAQQEGTTVSDLVRQAARDRFLRHSDTRREAMEGIIGIWKDRTDLPDTETYVRNLRKGTRLKRLGLL